MIGQILENERHVVEETASEIDGIDLWRHLFLVELEESVFDHLFVVMPIRLE